MAASDETPRRQADDRYGAAAQDDLDASAGQADARDDAASGHGQDSRDRYSHNPYLSQDGWHPERIWSQDSGGGDREEYRREERTYTPRRTSEVSPSYWDDDDDDDVQWPNWEDRGSARRSQESGQSQEDETSVYAPADDATQRIEPEYDDYEDGDYEDLEEDEGRSRRGGGSGGGFQGRLSVVLDAVRNGFWRVVDAGRAGIDRLSQINWPIPWNIVRWILLAIVVLILALLIRACSKPASQQDAPQEQEQQQQAVETTTIAAPDMLNAEVEPGDVYVNSANWDNLTTDDKGRIAYQENGQIISSIGIDVAKHQADIDWSAVAADGIDFAYLRCGNRGSEDGVIYGDDNFETNIKAAHDAGLKVGTYFFSQATTADEAREEADFVIDQLSKVGADTGGSVQLSYPIAFDFEPGMMENDRISNLSRSESTQIAQAFCSEIEQAGYQSIVYGSRSDLSNYDLVDLASYGFWYADYGSSPSVNVCFALWQFASDGKVDGIEGDVDLDLDLSALLNSGSSSDSSDSALGTDEESSSSDLESDSEISDDESGEDGLSEDSDSLSSSSDEEGIDGTGSGEDSDISDMGSSESGSEEDDEYSDDVSSEGEDSYDGENSSSTEQ